MSIQNLTEIPSVSVEASAGGVLWEAVADAFQKTSLQLWLDQLERGVVGGETTVRSKKIRQWLAEVAKPWMIENGERSVASKETQAAFDAWQKKPQVPCLSAQRDTIEDKVASVCDANAEGSQSPLTLLQLSLTEKERWNLSLIVDWMHDPHALSISENWRLISVEQGLKREADWIRGLVDIERADSAKKGVEGLRETHNPDLHLDANFYMKQVTEHEMPWIVLKEKPEAESGQKLAAEFSTSSGQHVLSEESFVWSLPHHDKSAVSSVSIEKPWQWVRIVSESHMEASAANMHLSDHAMGFDIARVKKEKKGIFLLKDHLGQPQLWMQTRGGEIEQLFRRHDRVKKQETLGLSFEESTSKYDIFLQKAVRIFLEDFKATTTAQRIPMSLSPLWEPSVMESFKDPLAKPSLVTAYQRLKLPPLIKPLSETPMPHLSLPSDASVLVVDDPSRVKGRLGAQRELRGAGGTESLQEAMHRKDQNKV